jgi:hypothetical protein
MRLNVKAMAITAGLMWAGAVLVSGLAGMISTGYGSAFLHVLASVYPGYKAAGTAGDLVVGILYALVDGMLGGLVFAWLYNRFAGGPKQAVSGVKA